MKELKKIRLIEEPKSEELLRSELEEALGGWNCGSYYVTGGSGSCNNYDSGVCSNNSTAGNYCMAFTF